MSDIAIRVENLGKKFRLGLTHDRTLRDLAQRWMRRLFGGRRAESIERRANGNGQLTTTHRSPSTDHRSLATNSGSPPSALRSQPDYTDHQPLTIDQSEFWALRDVSFEVLRGEVLGIIGRNGAGKSTLLKIVSQVTKPTTGRAEIYGRGGSLLEVGTGFHPELTGRENIYPNGSILGMTKREIDRKFDEIVEFAGVVKFTNTPVKRYSSGMNVRLGFAVAAGKAKMSRAVNGTWISWNRVCSL